MLLSKATYSAFRLYMFFISMFYQLLLLINLFIFLFYFILLYYTYIIAYINIAMQTENIKRI